MKLENLLRLLVHLTPLVPMAYGRYDYSLATAVAVALLYVKAKKLTATLDDLEEKGLASSKEYLEIERARNRWRYLTFLGKGHGGMTLD